MSTWDEHLADRLADAGYLAPAVDECGDYVTLVDAPLSEVMLVIREALLSDEAVERAAWGIHASHDRGDWEHEPAEVLAEYLNMARAALTAALGEGGADE